MSASTPIENPVETPQETIADQDEEFGAESQDKFAEKGNDSASDSESENGEDGEASGPQDDVEAEELEALKREAEEAGEGLEDGSGDGTRRKRQRRGEKDDRQTKSLPALTSTESTSVSDNLWELFLSGADPGSSTSGASTSNPAGTNTLPRSSLGEANGTAGSDLSQEEKGYVRVIQTYRFAGDDVRTDKILPVSHSDSQAFMKKQKKLGLPIEMFSSPDGASSSTAETKPSLPSDRSSPALDTSNLTAITSTAPPLPKAGPRRKKSSLAALSAAATSSKAPKMNTLEKSKMDWEGWKAGSSSKPGEGVGLTELEREEMEAQTKGGGKGLGDVKGYMERRNFLERVGGRLEDKVEESKGRKR